MAEIVFALGCGDRVVGVSEFTEWPAAAADLPRIGGALTPNRERILALRPDAILAQGQSEILGDFARQQGIRYRALPLDTLDDLRVAIRGCAEILGVEEAGRALLVRLESGFAGLRACGPVSVFIALGHVPGDWSGLMTTGSGTFLDQLVRMAGGRNIFADQNQPWPKISHEALIRRNPELILDFQPAPVDSARRAALADDWNRLGFARSRIRVLDDGFLLKPGPRAVDSATRIATAICGE